MKTFWIRFTSLAMVVVTLFWYNMAIDKKEQQDQIAKLNADLESAANEITYQKNKMIEQTNLEQAEGQQTKESKYVDGTYSGEGQGFGGLISVEVVIEQDNITAINILSAQEEDGAYFTMAKDIIPKMIESQSAQVDTISGATFSSTGIKNAVQQALEKGMK